MSLKKLLYGTLILVSLDQVTKTIAKKYLPHYIGNEEKSFLGIFDFKYNENKGLVLHLFSWLPNSVWLGIILNIATLIFFIWCFHYFNKKKYNSIYILTGFCFIFSSITGNLLDRIIFGYCRDFIVWFGPGVFNLADFYSKVAMVLFLIWTIKYKRGNSIIENKNDL